jgi:RNA polymerase sigma-70 factor (ECF subfamily)
MTSNSTGSVREADAAGNPGTERVDEWVRRAQKGESAAFDALVTTFSTRMYNLAYRMTNNAEDAADLTQEIFVKLHRTIDKFAWRSSFTTWLYALAGNTCRSGLRRIRRVSRAETVHLDAPDPTDENRASRDTVDSAPGPVENAERSELMEKIRAAIAGLEEDFRLTIILRDIQGLSYEEVADATGCSMGTVKSRLARARLKVRDALVKEGLTCSAMK